MLNRKKSSVHASGICYIHYTKITGLYYAHVRGGITLLDPVDAVEFVNNCNTFSNYVISNTGQQNVFLLPWKLRVIYIDFTLLNPNMENKCPITHPLYVRKVKSKKIRL